VRDRERKQVKAGKKVNGVPVGGGVLGFFFYPSVCREDPEERWRVLIFFPLLFAEEDRVDYSLFFRIELVS
jgi:hypothetical protein